MRLHRNLISTLMATVLAAVAIGCFGVPANGVSSSDPDSDINLDDLVPESAQDKPPAVTPRLVDVARQRGIDFRFHNDIVPKRFFLPEIMGGGAGWIDFDLDGRLDLYLQNGDYLVPQGGEAPVFNRLYRNTESGFEEIAELAGAACGRHFGQGVAVGDFNADGFPDIFLSNYGPNYLLLNNGDGTFSDVSADAGVDDPRWGSSCLMTDLNGDGLLDIYAANYTNATIENTPKEKKYGKVVGYAGPGDFVAQTDCVYLNQGDGRFEEASERLNLVGKDGKALAVAAMDFDDDGLVEVYVANDMAGNFMFTRSDLPGIKRPEGKLWHNVAVPLGSAFSDEGENEASMGIACGDFDQDKKPDIFLTHFTDAKSTLYRNQGELFFEDFSDESQIARISMKTLGFGTVAFDYDRNGALDLFVTNGNVIGPDANPNEMPPQLFINQGRGRFRDASDFAGDYFKGKYLGRGAAGGDYDNDGDTDILVTHVAQPYALLENQTEAAGSWIGFEATRKGRKCIHGAVVTIRTAGGEEYVAQFTAGGSYLSSPDHRVLISIPQEAAGETVEAQIRWPDGSTKDLGSLPTGRYWRIVEEEAPLAL